MSAPAPDPGTGNVALAHRRCGPVALPSRGEAGVVGGVEVLPFGVLVFVVGALLMTNAWAVIDAKLATSSAAREAARTFVEAPDGARGAAAAGRAGRDAMASYGKNPAKLDLGPRSAVDFQRCVRVTYEATYPVPAFSLPFGVQMGTGFSVTSAHSEIIDPYRSGLGPDRAC